METITLEEALDLFKLPRKVGEFEEKTVTIGTGRFGPYVYHDSKYVSLPKTYDPLEVTLDEAIELILAKREAEAKKHIKNSMKIRKWKSLTAGMAHTLLIKEVTIKSRKM